MSSSGSEDKNLVWTEGMLCFLREQRGCSDKRLVKKLCFNSVEEMHTQLQNRNLLDWLVGE
jgi:hypothetical protein